MTRQEQRQADRRIAVCLLDSLTREVAQLRARVEAKDPLPEWVNRGRMPYVESLIAALTRLDDPH